MHAMITVRDVHSLAVNFPDQAPRLFIVRQIRRTLSAVDADQACTPRTRSVRPSRGLSHTQFFTFSHVERRLVRRLSGKLARTNSGLQAFSLLYITNSIPYKFIAHLACSQELAAFDQRI